MSTACHHRTTTTRFGSRLQHRLGPFATTGEALDHIGCAG